MPKQIGVMGPGEGASQVDCDLAFELGRRIAEEGWVLISGGRREGVMDAVNRGARSAGGVTAGILPGGTDTGKSSALSVTIRTAMGSARNNINVLSSDVVMACGIPGPGTVSEIALALKAKKPVVLVGVDSRTAEYIRWLSHSQAVSVATADEAIAAARGLLLVGRVKSKIRGRPGARL